MENKYSLSARLLIVSGKLFTDSQGFAFYETPTGEKVNSRMLVAYLIAATVEDLKNKGLIEYKLDEISAVGGKLPVIVLKKKKEGGVGFEKEILKKLDTEKNLIDVVKEILGGMYQIPEHRILWLIRSEFPEREYMRQEKVTTLFIFSRQETRWISEKVKPLVAAWLEELTKEWDKVAKLNWLNTCVRNCNFAFSLKTEQADNDLHKKRKK